MVKKWIVRLTDAERVELSSVVKKRDREQETKVIALRLRSPPKGFANWSLRLLAQQVVALEIVPAISHETVHRRLKKTG